MSRVNLKLHSAKQFNIVIHHSISENGKNAQANIQEMSLSVALFFFFFLGGGTFLALSLQKCPFKKVLCDKLMIKINPSCEMERENITQFKRAKERERARP